MDTWIQTRTGKKIYPLDPDPEDIDPLDIAHGLAMKCRFSGQSREFYSVAQHSCLVASLCDYYNKDLNKWGLLHDASEAYLPDIVRPIKPHIQGFKGIEERMLQAIATRFDLPWPIPKEIKEYDTVMLKAEAMQLMDRDLDGWRVAQLDSPKVKGVRVAPVGPRKARAMFINRYEMYFGDVLDVQQLNSRA